MTRPLLEVCVSSAESGWLAAEHGADRLELCSVLQVGGVTPHPLLLKELRATGLPLGVLIRCRPGDFVYSPGEKSRMIAQSREFLDSGADFVVVGALSPEGGVDLDFLDQISAQMDPVRLVFHRAFDGLTDPFSGLDALLDRGWARVLTSGQKATARQGVTQLKALAQRGGGRISILPGGGIRAENAPGILRQTGLRELHASCLAAPEPTAPGFGSKELVDVALLGALRKAMNQPL